MTRYSSRLVVDDSDDTRAPSVSGWKRGEGAGTCGMGLDAVTGWPIAEGRKREEGGLLLVRAKKGTEGGMSPSGFFIFQILFSISQICYTFVLNAFEFELECACM